MKYLVIIAVILVILVLWFIATKNSIIILKNKIEDQKSQIDIQLKRRFDLIPNLVECVKGYAKHEKDTLEGVVEARNKYLSASSSEDQMKANGELSSAINKLFALAESYPELKANNNFLDLQQSLKETEEKISYSRQFFNDSVLLYNNKVEIFPSSIVAKLCHFEKRAFFEVTEAERENVKVKF